MKFLVFALTIGFLIGGLNYSSTSDGVSIDPDRNTVIEANPCNPKIRKCT